MTSLDFLYIALGGGFLILVVFLSIFLLYVTFLVRDVNKITEDLREVSEKIRSTVFEPFKVITEMTAGFGIVNELVEKIRARYAEHMEADESEKVEVHKEKTAKKEGSKSKSGFMVKKLNK